MYGLNLLKLFSDNLGDYSKVQFKLYNTTDGYWVTANSDDNGNYLVSGHAEREDDASVLTPGSSGHLFLKGLEDDIYRVTEINTDANYTLLGNFITMEIRAKESGKICGTCGKSELTAEAFENDNAKDMNDDNGSASAIVPIHVMNTRGYRLPKTGDAGTTLLAAGGITLAVFSSAAFILLLVFKKKIILTIKKAKQASPPVLKLTGGLRFIKETFMHKKRILLHVLFLVLFLIGIGAAAYPAFGNWYTEQKRSVVLTEYEKALAKIEDADLTDAFKQAEIYNDALFTGEIDEKERPDYGELLCTTEDGIMGYVEIPAIQIRLPIYHGCTENELSKGAGHLPSSSLPVGGKSTHAVLAAHSGRADSKMFTDLDQVKEGDLVYLYVLNKTLTYEVDKITVTTPDDTDAIQIIDGEDLLTLLTCTPYGTNTHRLLVRGHRIFPDETLSTSKPSEAKPEHPDTAVHRSTWTNEYRNGLTEGLLFALLILLISVFLYGIIRLKAKRS